MGPEYGKWNQRPSGAGPLTAEADLRFERLYRELQESRQLLASIADNLSEAIYRAAPSGELVFLNRAYLEMFGYSDISELRKLSRKDLCVDPAVSARLVEALRRDGVFRQQEIEFRRRDGSRFWGLASARMVATAAGEEPYEIGAITDITDRKMEEAEIRNINLSLEKRIASRTSELSASEARLRTIVEHAPEAVVVFDADTGRFRYGNSLACELYGYTPQELTQLGPAEVSPDFQPSGRRSAELAREKLQEAAAGAAPVFEWIHKHSSGRLLHTEVRLVRLPAEGEKLIRASIIDNTGRRRRERVQQATYEISEALHTSGDLQSLFRHIHTIVKGLMPAENFYIALYDEEQDKIHFPYHVDEVTPRPVPCPVGTGLTGYVFRLGKPLLVDEAMSARKRREGNYVTFEGFAGIRYVESGIPAAIWLGVPLIVAGKSLGVLAVQDYHNAEAYGEAEKQLLGFVAGQVALAIERKRVEQALRDSESKFRALFLASSQGVILHDDKHFLEVNPAAARMFGYESPEQLIGRGPWDTSPEFQPSGERSAECAVRYISECLREGSVRFEWNARTAQGSELPLEVILTRVDWGGRQIIQAALNDISDRKNAERELLKALAQEKELSQLKSNFVSMVSHEFRTPLGVILSSAEILEAYFDRLEPAERREQLLSIQKNTRRMATLMEEVLLLGMAEAGKLDFKPTALDLPIFCRRLIEDVLSATDYKCPIQFVYVPERHACLGDERLLRHIFSNLLSNAVKYSPSAAIVEVEIEQDGRTALCRIRDRGVGIHHDDISRLFQAFHRGSNVGQVPGSGLGLSIVKRCLELHNGTIDFQSKLNQGTTVTLRLPLFGDPPVPVRASSAEPQPPNAS